MASSRRIVASCGNGSRSGAFARKAGQLHNAVGTLQISNYRLYELKP